MTCYKAWLTNFDDSRKSKVMLTDSTSLETEGAGNMIIKRINGKPTIIEDMLYVYDMKWNLLSVGQLVEKRFSVIMKNEAFELFDVNNKLVLKSPLSMNKTFKTMTSSSEVW